MVSVGLAMLSLGLASQQNYREQPLPRIFSSKALNGDVRFVHLLAAVTLMLVPCSEQLGTPAQRAQPLAPHHIAGEMENVPANSQAFLSPTGRGKNAKPRIDPTLSLLPERYTNGVGTAPRNTKCAFPFIAGGQLFTDCTTE